MGRKKLSIFPPNDAEPSRSDRHADVSTTVAALSRLVHEPARLAILTVLSACQAADFVFLRTASGLSAGNLSIQLSRLEQAGLVEMERTIEKRRTLTMVRLTGSGKSELSRYWMGMESLRQQMRNPANAQPEPKKKPFRELSLSPA